MSGEGGRQAAAEGAVSRRPSSGLVSEGKDREVRLPGPVGKTDLTGAAGRRGQPGRGFAGVRKIKEEKSLFLTK